MPLGTFDAAKLFPNSCSHLNWCEGPGNTHKGEADSIEAYSSLPKCQVKGPDGLTDSLFSSRQVDGQPTIRTSVIIAALVIAQPALEM